MADFAPALWGSGASTTVAQDFTVNARSSRFPPGSVPVAMTWLVPRFVGRAAESVTTPGAQRTQHLDRRRVLPQRGIDSKPCHLITVIDVDAEGEERAALGQEILSGVYRCIEQPH